MAHNIAYKNNKHSFVSHKERAWHGLGTIVDDAMTAKEAIVLAGLDYNVRKDRVAVILPDDAAKSAKYVPNTYATYRTDTLDVFGIVSDRYEIVQNIDAFKFMDSVIGDGVDRAMFETAGALGNGQTIFITAKLPTYIKINGHDVIENYLVISNGHDGKSSLEIFLTPVRVVCANTLSYGSQVSKLKITLRHTTSINDKLIDARELLNVSNTMSNNMQSVLQELTKVKVTDVQAESYFNNLFLTTDEVANLALDNVKYYGTANISSRKKNVLNAVNTYYQSGIGQSGITGSAYGVYNAVTGYLSNVKSYTTDNKKMESQILGGTDYKLNSKALELALIL